MESFATVFTPFEWALIVMAGATTIGLVFFVRCSGRGPGYTVSGEGRFFGFTFGRDNDGDGGCSGDGGD
ncbi:hypothetical protein GCM10011316_28700 [Roseibium aquae]|uniref:Uncharacterized protein n=1 Tax=Roseibium aquae TaxID=1323746 RepID=A0A916TLY6_9HYPH|nr:hypothetical protein [Roseibium aquae]GGB54874.1 hypothetical protein GCM10011316_28700 [Roseibium aquae]